MATFGLCLGMREGEFYQTTNLNYSNSETIRLGNGLSPFFLYKIFIIFLHYIFTYFFKSVDFRRKVLKRYFGKA